MSTASAKRSLEPNVSPEFTEDETDGSSKSGEPRKKGSRPGRKPLDSEAKSKRTAQNRAAQRAFRERKEKKMKDLEEKVRKLEEINQQSVLEAEFLRGQLMTLVTELKKYRPENSNDSQVLEYLAKTENEDARLGESVQHKKDYNSEDVKEDIRHKTSFTFAFPWKGEFSSSNNDSSDVNDGTDNFLVQFPSPVSSKSPSLSVKQRAAFSSSVSVEGNHKGDSKNGNGSNEFAPGSNSAGWIDKFFYNDAEGLPPFYQYSNPGKIEGSNGYGNIMFSNQFNFNDKPDHQVSEFCAKLGQACGTKCRPIPQMLKRSSCSSPNWSKSPPSVSNTWDTPLEDSRLQKPSLEDNLSDPSIKSSNHHSSNGTASLIDNVRSPKKISEIPFIDTSLAFPEENDMFRESQQDSLFADFIGNNPSRDITNRIGKENNMEVQGQGKGQALIGSDNDTVVPPCKSKLLKCNEIWDRITSHPKYSHMDIDGLCQELMAKAKCSESGVVVQAEDLQCALDSR